MAPQQPRKPAQKERSIPVTEKDAQTNLPNAEEEPHGLCTCGQEKVVKGIRFVCRKDAFGNCVWQRVK